MTVYKDTVILATTEGFCMLRKLRT